MDEKLSRKETIIYLGIVLIVSALFIYWKISPATPTPPKTINPIYDQTLTPDERVMAEMSFPVFCDACKPLMSSYSADIESIEIGRGFDRDAKWGCMDYRCREYGWDKQFYIKVKLKENTSVIPASLRTSGHTLHYYLGGPQNSGITTSKIPELCGKTPTSNGKDVYIAEPKLSFIKGS